MALDVYKEWLGIPEDQRPPDHYQLLRLVRFEDDPEKIRAHYRKLNAHVRRYATGQYSVESQELLTELAKTMLCLTDAGRKRDYDESLGRVFEEKADALGRKPLGKVLIEQGHLTREQLEQAERHAEGLGLELRDAVVQMKLVDQPTAAQALGIELGIPYVDLAEMIPDDSVLDRVPRKLVKQHSLLPLFEDDGTLLVAGINPLSPDVEEELRLRLDMPVRCVLATPLAINQGIAKYYAAGMRDEAAQEAAGKTAKKPAGKRTDGAAAKKAEKQKAEKAKPAPTPDEASKQRKQIGIVAVCWSVVVAWALDQYVVTPNMVMDKYTYMLYLLIPGAVGTVVWLTCFKR